LVLAYVLAVATSGMAVRILMAGFDGYAPGDPRNDETAAVLDTYLANAGEDRLIAVTPTRHRLRGASIYADIP
jgi:4-hydroxy 2-oxovalerate aldolase